MNEVSFKIAFIVLWVVYILIRAPFTDSYKNAQKTVVVGAATEKVLLSLLAVGLLLVPMVWAMSPWLDGWRMVLPVWLRYTGLALAVASLFYFRWIHKSLGRNWSPRTEILEKHILVVSGPYRRLRHPMYAQAWLWTIAQVFIVSNWVAGLSGIVAWAVLYFVRVPREEKMMIDTFGDEYTDYMNRTGRVLPKL